MRAPGGPERVSRHVEQLSHELPVPILSPIPRISVPADGNFVKNVEALFSESYEFGILQCMLTQCEERSHQLPGGIEDEEFDVGIVDDPEIVERHRLRIDAKPGRGAEPIAQLTSQTELGDFGSTYDRNALMISAQSGRTGFGAGVDFRRL